MKQWLLLFFGIIFSASSWTQQTEYKWLSGHSAEDNVTWDFFCDGGQNSGKWTRIRVPSCWELEGFGAYNYGHDKNKASEKGLYKTSFTIPETWKNKRIFVVFDGSMTDTRVKVNGKQAGEIHQGAFYRFKREITSLLRNNKENLLEVEVSKMSANQSVNAAEREADFWVFGGIFRPVYLEAVPQNFIEYTGIDARQNGDINVEVFTDKTVTQGEVQVEVFEMPSGQKAGTFSSKADPQGTKHLTAKGRIPDVKPWSAESPQLYRAVVSVLQKGKKLHSVTERIGFRTIEVRERDGVYINGRKIRFKGVNRHCFWPSTGRTVSRRQSLEDVMLIKEMNMNAVRMSHYPPDTHFLEYCDSVGLYVIDELCAWQSPPYDTPVGTVLANELLKRDLNHPSIVFWANGNEGGFNYDLDPIFEQLDPQKRSVLHPWGLSGKINTAHYIDYNSGIKNMFNGRDIFMPTEFLHGLYDGGHGAGLEDYWNLMLSNPLSAGGFLWDFSDQGVVRTDKGGILDTDKDHGADGILGPYREKEGSFYTIKDIWSPVHLEKKYITPAWDGKLTVENRFDFTNTNRCSFSYSLSRFDSWDSPDTPIKGTITAPDIEPGHKGEIKMDLPTGWQEYDVLYLTAKDWNGRELFTRSFELNSPALFSERMLARNTAMPGIVKCTEDEANYILSASGVSIAIDKKTGLLATASNGNYTIPLTQGPVLISDRTLQCKNVSLNRSDGTCRIEVRYQFEKGGEAYRFSWKMLTNGILQLDYSYRPQDRMNMAGVTFTFPEEGVRGATLLANGPYRVYNNRMKGGTLNRWYKTYNDAITGEVWEYPEFKGYYSLFYGMKLDSPAPFEVYCATEDVTLHLFTPKAQAQYDPKRNYTLPAYPSGNLSFMDAIPSVGTKFGKAENYGPQSQIHTFKSYSGLRNMENRLYFNFK